MTDTALDPTAAVALYVIAGFHPETTGGISLPELAWKMLVHDDRARAAAMRLENAKYVTRHEPDGTTGQRTSDECYQITPAGRRAAAALTPDDVAGFGDFANAITHVPVRVPTD